jgi:hypothetical protein
MKTRLVGLLLIGLIGCGPSRVPTAKLSGTVTLDGKKIMTGQVRAVAEDGKYATTADINDDGEYLIQNAPVGPVKIAVAVMESASLPTVPPEMKDKEDEFFKNFFKDQKDKVKIATGADLKKQAARQESVRKLPKKYADHKASGLTATVESGGTTYDIKLTTSAK